MNELNIKKNPLWWQNTNMDILQQNITLLYIFIFETFW